MALAELAAEVLPPGVLNVVLGDGAAGAALAAHPGLGMVALTGSIATGSAVARAAAGTLARVHLELGGKAPVIVFDDADPEAAAEAIGYAAFYNAGQDCTAATRVLAAAPVHDAVVDGLARVGGRPGARHRPRRHARPAELGAPARARDRLPRAPRRRTPRWCTAARSRRGPATSSSPPSWPACATTTSSRAARSSVPSSRVERFGDEAEALAWANGTDYGLAASVWTRDIGRALRVSRALHFGCVWINAHGLGGSELPARRLQGVGLRQGPVRRGVDEHTRIKHVMAALA